MQCVVDTQDFLKVQNDVCGKVGSPVVPGLLQNLQKRYIRGVQIFQNIRATSNF
jgi:hypothetical protein